MYLFVAPAQRADINLAAEHRKLTHVIKDGNSFFRAVSCLFAGHQMHYMKWRKMIVAFESIFPDLIFHRDLLDSDLRYEHIQKMLVNRTPASEFELVALATMAQTQVYVYEMTQYVPPTFVWKAYMPRFSCSELDEKGYVALYREGHVYGLVTDMYGSSKRLQPESVSGYPLKYYRSFENTRK